MRKLVLLFIFAILAAVALYLGVGKDSYVLLRIGDWAMQMTLFVAILAVLLLIVFLRLSFGLFRGILLGGWPQAWRRRRQQTLNARAIENIAKGNSIAARKNLVKLANSSAEPLPLIILSAQSSESAGDYEEAKAVYGKAIVDFPEWTAVIQIRLCHIALVEGNLPLAEQLLADVESDSTNDAQVQMLKIRLYEEQRNWDLLQKSLQSVRKKESLHALVAPIERRYLRSRLLDRPGARDLLQLADYVRAVGGSSAEITGQLAQQLSMRGHNKEAEALVRKILNSKWDEALVAIYAEVEARSPKSQLKTAEGWLAEHPDSEALLQCIKTLAEKAGDESKVDAYAEKLSQLSLRSQDEQEMV